MGKGVAYGDGNVGASLLATQDVERRENARSYRFNCLVPDEDGGARRRGVWMSPSILTHARERFGEVASGLRIPSMKPDSCSWTTIPRINPDGQRQDPSKRGSFESFTIQ